MDKTLIEAIRENICKCFFNDETGCPSDETNNHKNCMYCADDFINGWKAAQKTSPNKKLSEIQKLKE